MLPPSKCQSAVCASSISCCLNAQNQRIGWLLDKDGDKPCEAIWAKAVSQSAGSHSRHKHCPAWAGTGRTAKRLTRLCDLTGCRSRRPTPFNSPKGLWCCEALVLSGLTRERVIPWNGGERGGVSRFCWRWKWWGKGGLGAACPEVGEGEWRRNVFERDKRRPRVDGSLMALQAILPGKTESSENATCLHSHLSSFRLV